MAQSGKKKAVAREITAGEQQRKAAREIAAENAAAGFKQRRVIRKVKGKWMCTPEELYREIPYWLFESE